MKFPLKSWLGDLGKEMSLTRLEDLALVEKYPNPSATSTYKARASGQPRKWL